MKIAQHGSIFPNNCFNANAITGNNNLKHPIIPKIYWYVAYVEDCMNGMVQQEESNEHNEIRNEVASENASMQNTTENISNSVSAELGSKIKIIPNPTENSFSIESNGKFFFNRTFM